MTRSNAKLWINDPDDVLNGDPPVQGDEAAVTIERTEANEVAIHATVPGDGSAVSSIYLTNAEAALLAARLSAEAATPEGDESRG